MRATAFFLAGLLGVAAAGCGEGGVKAEGKVVKNGAPFTLSEGEVVTLTLTSADGKTTYTSNAQPDGTFSVQKPAGGPIPAGKYKVHYVHQLAASPYTKKAGFKVSKDVPDEWDVSSNPSLTVDIGTK